MKTCFHHNTLGGLLNERLAILGATNIPNSARQLIEADLWSAVATLIQRRVTAPTVGRAVARALAEGCKGDVSPLPSRQSQPKAQIAVAGHATDTTAETADPSTGEGV
jgi:hypothetical protein